MDNSKTHQVRYTTIECVKRAEQPISAETNGIVTIARLARAHGISSRALRFYQDKGLLSPVRRGKERLFAAADCERLALILQGRRLGFTLTELRQMLAAWRPGAGMPLPIGRKNCVEQINLLERQRRDIDAAIAELRQIYTRMFMASEASERG
jgi:DNA-binding transcriptional MerR regulator